jgi:hypothetical protein
MYKITGHHTVLRSARQVKRPLQLVILLPDRQLKSFFQLVNLPKALPTANKKTSFN